MLMVDDMTAGDELPHGTVLLHGQYIIQHKIGSGGFGITYLAKDSLDRDVTVKECFFSGHCTRNGTLVSMRPRESSRVMTKLIDQFVMEAQTLSSLDHPNVVKVHDVFRENDTAYMALEYLPGHDLLDAIEGTDLKFGQNEIFVITCKLVSAVHHIHQSNVLHGDISPDNIVMKDEYEPILIDFGSSRQGDPAAAVGHPGFSHVKDGYSPYESYIPDGRYGPSSDLYALAASIYHAVTGVAPVSSEARLLATVQSGTDPCASLAGRFSGYPSGFLESLDKAMNIRSADRFQTAEEWLGVLNSCLNYEDQEMKLLGKTIRIGSQARSEKAAVPPVLSNDSDITELAKPQKPKQTLKGNKMVIDLSGLKDIGGFISGCLVDVDSGLMMASETVGTFDIETAAAANVDVVRAKNKAMSLLGLNDSIEDILITLSTQLHLIRPLEKNASYFVYVALDRKTANLGMARAQVKKVEQGIKF